MEFFACSIFWARLKIVAIISELIYKQVRERGKQTKIIYVEMP